MKARSRAATWLGAVGGLGVAATALLMTWPAAPLKGPLDLLGGNSACAAGVPCDLGAVTGDVVEKYGNDLTAAFSRSNHGPDLVGLSAKELRNSPGVATVSRALPSRPEKMMRGTGKNAGIIPQDVASKLEGREFRSFDDFRKNFWEAVAESPYAKEFSASSRNLDNMKTGKAPFTLAEQRIPGRPVYELHHVQPIQRGGNVYDMSNLFVVSPRFHQDVLDRAYHYGK